MNAAEREGLDLKLRACHRHEQEAMNVEFGAVKRGDHDAAAKAHADRRHWINEAGKIIDRLAGLLPAVNGE